MHSIGDFGLFAYEKNSKTKKNTQMMISILSILLWTIIT